MELEVEAVVVTAGELPRCRDNCAQQAVLTGGIGALSPESVFVDHDGLHGVDDLFEDGKHAGYLTRWNDSAPVSGLTRYTQS
ncbi:hypothetical protein ACU686_12450 [Yinghuangia aomiensis]